MSNQWSDNLRKRMETHQEPSPKGLWEDIEQIVKKEGSLKKSTKQNRILLWAKCIGAVAAITLVLLFIDDFLRVQNFRESQIISQKKHTPYEHKNNRLTERDNEQKLIAENNSNRVSPYTPKSIPVVDSLCPKEENDFIAELEEKKEHKDEYKRENSMSEANIDKKKCNNRSNSIRQNPDNNGLDQDTYLPVIRDKRKSTKWEANLYASNISSSTESKNEGYGSFISEEMLTQGEEGEPTLGDDPQNDILVQNKYREVYTDIKHKQPIIIGVSANYNLDNKWSLTTGLTYTILSSQLRSGSDSYYYTSEQTLHNIGIPISINYNVWENRKISIYLSAGGLVEKNVFGKLTTDYIVDDQLKSSRKDKISIDRPQWSINSAVGVQFNFSPKVALYAEPGASYYFKNGSEVETIYKEKPLNLSIRLGLRFSLNK